MSRLRVALFGSPAFALRTLDGLNDRHDLVLVVSQPDKPAGRGLSVRPSAVASRARHLGLELWQPTKLKSDEAFLERLAEAHLDVAVTAAYGRILPRAVLDAPRNGVLNVHASLLPKYRGAAPIQWALIDGEKETGVSIMQTEAGLDTGPVRLQRRVSVHADETAPELMSRLSAVGAEALLEALDRLAAGTLPSLPQDDAAASSAPLLTVEDGHVRWNDPAKAVFDRFRGVAAWPGTSFEFAGERVKVSEMSVVDLAGSMEVVRVQDARPGSVLEVAGECVVVVTGAAEGADGAHGAVRLERVKPPGGREMSAQAWANGRRIEAGDRLG